MADASGIEGLLAGLLSALVSSRRVVYSEHALDRMLDRDITVEEVAEVLEGGETIEEYADGGRLVLGRAGLRVLHVVVADRPEATVIVTVYPPDPRQWDAAFRGRIKP